jgi:hypothetical protein
MARYINCRKGLHNYSSACEAGGGIARRSCFECGQVQIDLSGTAGVSDTDLFTETKLASIFEVEALLAKVASAPAEVRRAFGEAPTRRRRPARASG